MGVRSLYERTPTFFSSPVCTKIYKKGYDQTLIIIVPEKYKMGILVGFAFVTLFVLFLTAEIKLSLELVIDKMV